MFHMLREKVLFLIYFVFLFFYLLYFQTILLLFAEHIVMTPKSKTSNSTTLIIERQALDPPAKNGNESNVHIAGGDHKGIVINKRAVAGEIQLFLPITRSYRILSVY